MARINVGIVNRSRIMRDAVVSVISCREQFHVVWDCASEDEARGEIAGSPPDVVVVECGFPGDRDCIARLAAEHRELAVVVSGVDICPDQLSALAAAGSRGYIRADAAEEEWITAIEGAVRCEIHDPVIAGMLNDCLSRAPAALAAAEENPPAENAWHISARVGRTAQSVGLTARERQVLELIDRGMSNKDIGRSLDIEPATVKAHVHSILGKYNVSRRGEAAARFRSTRRGVYNPE